MPAGTTNRYGKSGPLPAQLELPPRSTGWQDPGRWLIAVAWSTTEEAWAVTAPVWLKAP